MWLSTKLALAVLIDGCQTLHLYAIVAMYTFWLPMLGRKNTASEELT